MSTKQEKEMWQQKLRYANIAQELIKALEGHSYDDALGALSEAKTLIVDSSDKKIKSLQVSEKVSLKEEAKKNIDWLTDRASQH